MGEKLSSPGLEGSGQRAMRENEKALAAVEQQMEVLRQRALNGEVVDVEIKKLQERYNLIKQDRGRIQMGGM